MPLNVRGTAAAILSLVTVSGAETVGLSFRIVSN
jgi:hypothetical protein